MRTLMLRALVGVCLLAAVSHASPNGTIGASYERLICVVPLVGAGTLDDPKRPMFAPVQGDDATARKGSKGFVESASIISYHSVLTDDGLFAIVEFVARDRAAFEPILSNKLNLTVLDPRKTPVDTLLQRLRLLKRNFDLTSFLAGAL